MKKVFCDRCGNEVKVSFRSPGIGHIVGYEEVCAECREILLTAQNTLRERFEAALISNELNLLVGG